MPVVLSSGTQAVRSATVQATSAQIKNVAAVPLVLVPTPGAQQLLVPSLIVALYHFVTTAYTVVQGWRLGLGANPSSPAIGSNWSLMGNNLLVAVANTIGGFDWGFEVLDSGGAFLSTDSLGKPLTLGSLASPTLGDGTLSIVTFYSVTDFS